MTPSTTITTIALHDFKSTPTTTATENAAGTPLAHGRNPRTVAVLAWLTERLDWEDRLDHLNEQNAEDRDADIRARLTHPCPQGTLATVPERASPNNVTQVSQIGGTAPRRPLG
jgi:hypothetical protein